MSLLEQLVQSGPQGPQHVVGRKKYPDGWQPRADVDDVDGGYVVSMPVAADQVPASHAEILSEFGLSPDDWTVERVRRSRWQIWDGSWLESQRLSLLPRQATAEARADMDRLTTLITDFRPGETAYPARDGAFVSPWGDYQYGKIDGGGSEATVQRVLAELEQVIHRYRRLGHFEQVVLPMLGDCIEGINSQGGALIKRTDLTMTEMVRLYRRMLWATITAFAGTGVPKILVPVVPGNHDEPSRIAGKMASTYDDSWAIDGASAVMDAVNQNSDLRDRVGFVFPGHDEMTITLDVAGTVIGMAHGHQFGRDALKWWDGQAGGRQPIGDAHLLLAGHSHHLKVIDHGTDKLFLQVPAMDGGSNWFRHRTGNDSRSRAVSFWTADGRVHELEPVL